MTYSDDLAIMRRHVKDLARIHKVTIKWVRDGGSRASADRKNRVICTPRIDGYITYITALHELGHVIANRCSYEWPLIDQEVAAWQWAMRKAKVPLPHAVFDAVADKLETYKEGLDTDG